MGSDLLNGLVVLNTRPVQQQQALSDAIVASGGISVSLPLLSIDPVTDPEELEKIRDQISHVTECDALVFVSANAVAIAAPLIKEALPSLPENMQLFAIGPATATELHKHFRHEVLQPQAGTTSEALLQLPQLQALQGRHFIIVRGRGGRETLRQALEDRGARVDYLELYSRHRSSITRDDLERCLRDNKVNALVITSGESLQQLLDLSADNKGRLTLLPLIVPSARIAALAEEAGFVRVIEAAGAGEAAVVAALLTIADNFG